LTGGAGADRLLGAAGADRFDFNAIAESVVGTGRDTVADFSGAQGDRIDLAGIDANANAGGDQAFAFIGGAFAGVAGQLRAVASGPTASCRET
jgi:Ca2+-binding RTX toxin-like protein